MVEDPPDFRLLFEASPEVLLVLLPDAPRFTMVAATESRLAVTHTTREATMGRGIFEVFPDNPDDPDATGTSRLRASLERVVATGAPDTMAVQKYDIPGPDGTFQVKYWSPKNVPILSAAGDVRYILHRVEDVTDLVNASREGDALKDRTRAMEREVVARSLELAAANRELRDSNAKLAELDAAKTAFFSNVSHEFRTPLTLMLGPLEDALADPTLARDERLRNRIHLAHDNALRLLKLVNALLNFARLDAGRLAPSYSAIDLGDFTARIAGMFESVAQKANIALEIDSPSMGEIAWVDRDMWEKVVLNLISNAFKFTTTGRVTVRLRGEGENVVLEVEDTGIGIPATELDHIFKRFYRVAGSGGRTFEGTGIGLSLVRELAEMHGGTARAASVEGEGTTFRVTIPRTPPSGAPPHPASGDEPEAASRDAEAHVHEIAAWNAPSTAPLEVLDPKDSRAHVLIVDDNAGLRAHISDLLKPHYRVTLAVDGLDALERLKTARFDLVVSDVMMPRMDGLQLVRAIRAQDALAQMPVILVSARTGEDAVSALTTGCDDYVTKPFAANELLARVRTHLGLATLRRDFVGRLQNANEELSAFNRALSHDMRAPLRAVNGYREMLRKNHAEALGASGSRHLERIGQAVDRATRLVDGLLHLSAAGDQPLRREWVDVSGLASRIVHDLRAGHPDQQREISIEEGMRVEADPRLLEIALTNLIGNAWKYTSRTAEPKIEIGRDRAPDFTIHVRDNGAGFSMAYAHRLFVPLSRLHNSSEFEGSGIGLATVRRAITRQSGRVWADAAEGTGATFYISLPAAVEAGTP